jgi:hypothetical protein
VDVAAPTPPVSAEPDASDETRDPGSDRAERRGRSDAISEEPVAPALSIDGAVQAGPALSDSAWRLGGFLRPAFRPAPSPWLVVASVGYFTSPSLGQELGVSWAVGSVAVGYSLVDLPESELRLRAGVLGERVSARARDPASRTTDEGSAYDVGATIGADGAWAPFGHLGLVAGFDLETMLRSLDVRVQQTTRAHGPPVRYGIFAGLRIDDLPL